MSFRSNFLALALLLSALPAGATPSFDNDYIARVQQLTDKPDGNSDSLREAALGLWSAARKAESLGLEQKYKGFMARKVFEAKTDLWLFIHKSEVPSEPTAKFKLLSEKYDLHAQSIRPAPEAEQDAQSSFTGKLMLHPSMAGAYLADKEGLSAKYNSLLAFRYEQSLKEVLDKYLDETLLTSDREFEEALAGSDRYMRYKLSVIRIRKDEEDTAKSLAASIGLGRISFDEAVRSHDKYHGGISNPCWVRPNEWVTPMLYRSLYDLSMALQVAKYRSEQGGGELARITRPVTVGQMIGRQCVVIARIEAVEKADLSEVKTMDKRDREFLRRKLLEREKQAYYVRLLNEAKSKQ